jgi:hypothetical protein
MAESVLEQAIPELVVLRADAVYCDAGTLNRGSVTGNPWTHAASHEVAVESHEGSKMAESSGQIGARWELFNLSGGILREKKC